MIPARSMLFGCLACVPALAQERFAEPGFRAVPRVESLQTPALSVLDMDRDGWPDLFLGSTFGASANPQDLAWRNDGRGVLLDETEARMPILSTTTYASATGDVDRDGDEDVVLGTDGQDRLLLNDGAGVFLDATSRLPRHDDLTTSVALADFDGDGDLDLAIGTSGFGGSQTTFPHNRLFLNDGSGTFTDVSASHLPLRPNDPYRTQSIAAGDLDGDGDPDLVLGNVGQLRYYENDGAAHFADRTGARLPPSTAATEAVVLFDMDGDGDLDLFEVNGPAFGRDPQDRLYRNDGSGRFSDVTATALPTDSWYDTHGHAHDVDGDGDLDLLIGGFGQGRLLRNDGTGRFQISGGALPPLGGNAIAMAFADFDGDGDLDIVECISGFGLEQSHRLLTNRSNGVFDEVAARIEFPESPRDTTNGLAVGDVDGDGDLDVILGNQEQDRLFENDGSGRFTDATAGHLPMGSPVTNAVVLEDLDGDGDLDLAIATRGGLGSTGQDIVYGNDGTGRFTELLRTVERDWTASVAACDVDGDGDADLVFGRSSSALASTGDRLYRNPGNGQVVADPSAWAATGGATNDVAFGDLDGDGDPDAILAKSQDNSGPGIDRLLLNDGNGRFTDATPGRLPLVAGQTYCVALGDVDRDGDLDAVLGDRVPGMSSPMRLLLNDGSGRFTLATAGRLDASTAANGAAFSDVDLDGDLDLVVATGDPLGSRVYRNLLFLNDGAGRFQDASSAMETLGRTMSVAVGDVDRDGDADILFGNSAQSSVVDSRTRLLLNRHRQLETLLERYPHDDLQIALFSRPGYATGPRIAMIGINTALAGLPIPTPYGELFLAPTGTVTLPPRLLGFADSRIDVQVSIPPGLQPGSLLMQGLVFDLLVPGNSHLTGYRAERIH